MDETIKKSEVLDIVASFFPNATEEQEDFCRAVWARVKQCPAANAEPVLPCKVGDKVYERDAERVYESTVKNLFFETESIAFDETAIGITVFLTRAEAEEDLKRYRDKQ